MPVIGTAVSVGTAATQIAWPDDNSQYVYVQNGDYDGDAEIYVGPSDVSAANGFRVWRSNNTVFQIEAGDSLYAIASADATSVRVVAVRQD